ncbi:MAG: hypothetical protein DRO99_00780 [Candidatus Aenigmatarchaeota archaeon]|nr:MAG: hypothetical protein DRO99_00780 [Candidatus Aenigmarchaeota archaeon]
MKIVICGSVNFPEKMKEVRAGLEELGHSVVLPASIDKDNLNSYEDAQRLKTSEDYIDRIKGERTIAHFNEIKEGDAILVVNPEKKGIPNYIGGATFAEMMFAFYCGKPIFLLNPIPDHEELAFFRDEIKGTKPVVINGDLSLVKHARA